MVVSILFPNFRRDILKFHNKEWIKFAEILVNSFYLVRWTLLFLFCEDFLSGNFPNRFLYVDIITRLKKKYVVGVNHIISYFLTLHQDYVPSNFFYGVLLQDVIY